MNTKEALLDSAENAVRRSGYDGFSYADLAADVGIRKASIHYHFPTKASLALELMQRYHADMQKQLAAIDALAGNAGERLKGQISRYREALANGKKLCLCVAFSISTESLDTKLTDELNRYRTESIDWLKSVFDAAQADGSIVGIDDPLVEARACIATLEGAHLAARAESNIRRFDEALQALVERIRS